MSKALECDRSNFTTDENKYMLTGLFLLKKI